MRISDWSSDVCSSDLTEWPGAANAVMDMQTRSLFAGRKEGHFQVTHGIAKLRRKEDIPPRSSPWITSWGRWRLRWRTLFRHVKSYTCGYLSHGIVDELLSKLRQFIALFKVESRFHCL